MNILLTGYSGNLGQAVAKSFSAEDINLKVLLHGAAILPNIVPKNIEIVWGSLLDAEAMFKLTRGINVVIHSAWDGRGNESQMKAANLNGTLCLLKSSIENNVDKFIYISSVGVYGLEKKIWGVVIDENQPYVSKEESMDPYPWVKVLIEQECSRIVSENDGNIEFTTIRPGLLFSEHKAPAKKFNPSKKKAILFGKGNNHLPYIHVDDVAELIKIILLKKTGSEVYNCVPTELISAANVIKKWGKYYNKETIRITFFPPWFVQMMGVAVKMLKQKLGKDSGGDINYPIMTGIRDIRYSNRKAVEKLGWSDKITQQIANA